MVDNVQPRSLSCFRIRKRRHENRMDLRRAKTQEPLNMTWAGKQSEQPRSFQSETYLLLTFPALQGLDQVFVKWNCLLRGLGLAGADHLTYHRSRHSELSDFEINILPLQTEQFALSQSGAYVQEHQDSFSRW